MSVFGLIRGFRSSDSTAQPLRLDKATNTIQIIDYEHHEIHAGSHFEIADSVNISINNVREIRITAHNSTKWVHLTFSLSVVAETEVYLYEDVTLVTAGSAITPINNDRNSTTASVTVVDYIDNSSVANANSDTTVSGYIDHVIMGAGKNAGFALRAEEIILKQGKIYSLRFIANAAGFVNYKLQWYEHTNIA